MPQILSSIFAYIDPGTGSILLQSIIAGIAAVGVAFTAFRHRVGAVFRRVLKKGKGPDADAGGASAKQAGHE